MNRIAQRGAYDCGIAAMAMLLDISYEAAAEALGRDVAEPNTFMREGKPAGVLPDEMVAIAWRLGRPAAFIRTREFFRSWAPEIINGQGGAFALLSTRNLVRQFLPGRAACVVLPSLNVPGGAHWIAWDGKAVFDPSPGQRYQEMPDDVEIAEAVLLTVPS